MPSTLRGMRLLIKLCSCPSTTTTSPFGDIPAKRDGSLAATLYGYKTSGLEIGHYHSFFANGGFVKTRRLKACLILPGIDAIFRLSFHYSP